MEFFNELGKKFTQAARSMQERTRESVESTRLNADWKAAQEELDRRLVALGRAYYDSVAAKSGRVDPELIDRVRESMTLVDTLTAQRERAMRQVRCPGCGTMQAEDARFCSHCGRPMPEKDPDPSDDAPAEGAEYCARCGAMRRDQAKYCAVCGYGFEESETLPSLRPEKPDLPPAEPLEEPEESDLYGE